jgi:glycosyltransferase involved in cell wall biosynthesis
VRAALYYPWIYLKGGAERMILELVGSSRHEWTLYTNRFEPDATFPGFRDLRVVSLSKVPVRRTVGGVLRAGVTIRAQRVRVERHDAAFVVSEGLGNLVAGRWTPPTSCICLTPLKVAYDPVTRDRFFDRGARSSYRLAFAVYRGVDRSMWRHYHRVFCISEEVRRRVLAARLVEDARLEVAYPGVDGDRFRPTGEREPLFLLPGRIMWQKNVELALQAWRRFKPEPTGNDHRLVVAGMVDGKSRGYLEGLRRTVADRPDVRFVVSPSDDELLGLYQRCRAVVFTAPNEDFGLVPLEGMACGKPVLAPDRGGPAETVIDGGTGFLRPADPRAFAEAMARIAAMTEPELELIASRARTRAMEFSWTRFVDRIDGHVEDLANSGKDVSPGLVPGTPR